MPAEGSAYLKIKFEDSYKSVEGSWVRSKVRLPMALVRPSETIKNVDICKKKES